MPTAPPHRILYFGKLSFSPILYFLLLFNSPFFITAAPEPISEAAQNGEKLFKANCTSCHKVTTRMVGPALMGAEQRWTSAGDYNGVSGREWLNRWVKNSQGVIKEGYPYANKLFEDFNKSVMTSFSQFSDKDIADLMKYIEYTAAQGSQPAPNTPGSAVKTGAGDVHQLILIFLVGLFSVIALALGMLISELNGLVLQKQGIVVEKATPFYKRKRMLVALGIILFIYLGYSIVIGSINLGRQQGYSPDQPIKYSHQLHAGLNSIACQYCHFGASKSKTAGIPSENVCMNCHKGIQEGSIHGKYGRKEIAKIYASIGFDPNTLSYIKDYNAMNREEAVKLFTNWLKGDEKHKQSQRDINEVLQFIQKPIQWVRIHNLPDHVYFDHSQHVTVGGLQCLSCHGQIQEMEKVYQYAPLSMGWCVNCHRTTEVNFTGNKFYDDYQGLHEALKTGKKDRITVETIGGTDCQKCHY